VRLRRSSIVDISWCSSNAAHLITKWVVDADTESLSDHKFIQIGVRATPGKVLSCRAKKEPPRRWALQKLDEDALVATVLAKSLCFPLLWESIGESVEWIGTALEEISDASMPRC
jgi:hypothetical protein